MVHEEHVWLFWSSAFLVPWLGLYLRFPRQRKIMLWSSVLTMPFGLTEPLFLPQYWNPPSLFDLAQKTGFDLESLIFCFCDRRSRRSSLQHNCGTISRAGNFGRKAKAGSSLPSHPVASAGCSLSVALYAARESNLPCHRGNGFRRCGNSGMPKRSKSQDAGRGNVVCNLLCCLCAAARFHRTGLYSKSMESVGSVRDNALGIPVEELLFGFSFGTYWSGIFEHLTWQGPLKRGTTR